MHHLSLRIHPHIIPADVLFIEETTCPPKSTVQQIMMTPATNNNKNRPIIITATNPKPSRQEVK